MNLHHLQYRKRIPPTVANVVADRNSTDVSVGSEKVLMDFLIAGLFFSPFLLLMAYIVLTTSFPVSSWTSFQVSCEQDVS